jgi:hypothetical protein
MSTGVQRNDVAAALADAKLLLKHVTCSKLADKYKVAGGNKLGAGAYGSVYKAVELSTGRLVAVKKTPLSKPSFPS